MVITHLQDHLGSEHFTTNSAGNVNGTTTYFPFGAVQNSSSNGQYANNFAYLGEEKDTESGLSYLNARYYHPVRGVFQNQDPVFVKLGDGTKTWEFEEILIRDPQLLNSYSYGRNNPYTHQDQSGESIDAVIQTAHTVVFTTGDILTFGQYSRAFEAVGASGERMSQEGVNVATVTNVVVSVGTGTVAAGGGALMTGMTAGEVVAGIGAVGATSTTAKLLPKPGAAGGPGAGKAFPQSVKNTAKAESGNTCVFCGTKTTSQKGPTQSNIDHAIPKVQGGNNTLSNAQNTCRACNLQKGAQTTLKFLSRLFSKR